MFEPVARKSLTEGVFEQLRGRILSGEVAAGGDLPSERQLADMLQVSRPAVREALQRLEQARLVSIRQGGATRVRDFRTTAGMDLVAPLLVTADGGIDPIVARSILEMRAAIAPDIARLAAMRASAELRDRIDGVVARMREAKGRAPATPDLLALQRLSLELWDLLVEGSGNVAYRLAFNSLRETSEQLEPVLTGVLAEQWSDVAGYAALAAAIRRRQPRVAEMRARALVCKGTSSILAMLEQLPHPAP